MSTRTASLPQSVMLAQELATPALKAAVDRLCPAIGRVAGYHYGWLDALGRSSDSNGGKMLRPALALLSAQAAGRPPTEGIPAAVAVELIHGFSLLHDDIIDGDTERRHRATAWSVFGSSLAVLAGDSLLTAALEALFDQPLAGSHSAAHCLAATTQRLITGQASDMEFERRQDVSVTECVAMAGNKTAALFGCAASLGALLVGGAPRISLGLARFGEHLGIAFQLVDDLLGIWGAPEVTGKPVLSDLRSRKKSLPVVAALQSGETAAASLARLYFRPEPMDEDELATAASLIELVGGRRWAEEEAARRLREAQAHLDELELPADIHGELMAVARFMTGRNH